MSLTANSRSKPVSNALTRVVIDTANSDNRDDVHKQLEEVYQKTPSKAVYLSMCEYAVLAALDYGNRYALEWFYELTRWLSLRPRLPITPKFLQLLVSYQDVDPNTSNERIAKQRMCIDYILENHQDSFSQVGTLQTAECYAYMFIRALQYENIWFLQRCDSIAKNYAPRLPFIQDIVVSALYALNKEGIKFVVECILKEIPSSQLQHYFQEIKNDIMKALHNALNHHPDFALYAVNSLASISLIWNDTNFKDEVYSGFCAKHPPHEQLKMYQQLEKIHHLIFLDFDPLKTVFINGDLVIANKANILSIVENIIHTTSKFERQRMESCRYEVCKSLIKIFEKDPELCKQIIQLLRKLDSLFKEDILLERLLQRNTNLGSHARIQQLGISPVSVEVSAESEDISQSVMPSSAVTYTEVITEEETEEPKQLAERASLLRHRKVGSG